MKLIINKSEIMSSFFGDKHLIGVRYPHHFSDFVTHVYDYLAIKFENNNEPIKKNAIIATDQQGLFATSVTDRSSKEFQVLTAVDDIEKSKHTLYQNRQGTEYLVGSKPELDFIWSVADMRRPELKSTELIKKINKIPGVQVSQYMELKSLRNASYLII